MPLDEDLEQKANLRAGVHACCSLLFQALCLVSFLLLTLWGTAAVLEVTHLLGVDTLPGGVMHSRVGPG